MHSPAFVRFCKARQRHASSLSRAFGITRLLYLLSTCIMVTFILPICFFGFGRNSLLESFVSRALHPHYAARVLTFVIQLRLTTSETPSHYSRTSRIDKMAATTRARTGKLPHYFTSSACIYRLALPQSRPNTPNVFTEHMQ
jgi:hypothetical protein